VDFSRLFPPVYYERSPKDLRFLHQLFRPEFVRTNQQRLYSDSLSPFISSACNESATQRLMEATAYLKEQTIPSFAQLLTQQPPTETSFAQLIPAIHRQGINIRYLGLIFKALCSAPEKQNAEWMECLMIEMMARVCKCVLRSKLRDQAQEYHGFSRPTQFVKVAVEFLNQVFSPSLTQDFWGPALFHLQEKFPVGDSSSGSYTPGGLNEITWEYIVQLVSRADYRLRLFYRLHALVGIRFTSNARTQFTEGFFQRDNPFHPIHIDDLVPMVKNLIVMDLNNGIVLKRESGRLPVDNPIRRELLEEARICFTNAFDNNPSDIDCILHIADVCRKLECEEEAVAYLSLAVRMTDEARVKYKIARFCHKTGHEDTQQCYYKALAADPNAFATWFHFAEYLTSQGGTHFEPTTMAFGVCKFLGQTSLDDANRLIDLVSKYETDLGVRSGHMWPEIQKHTSGDLNQYWSFIFNE